MPRRKKGAGDITQLSVEGLAKLLGVSAEEIYGDVSRGAPRNADGSMNLLHYVAWLVHELLALESKR